MRIPGVHLNLNQFSDEIRSTFFEVEVEEEMKFEVKQALTKVLMNSKWKKKKKSISSNLFLFFFFVDFVPISFRDLIWYERKSSFLFRFRLIALSLEVFSFLRLIGKSFTARWSKFLS